MAGSEDLGHCVFGYPGRPVHGILKEEATMTENGQQTEQKTEFEPLEIMGFFWLFFGIVVLLATFFVKGTENVPLMRGIVTNILAAILLLAAGLISLLKGRTNKRRKRKSPEVRP
jgi:hypothetical protein